jgi:molecular chaperone HtpG
MPSLPDYKGKSLKPVDRAETEAPAAETPPDADRFKDFLAALKGKLPEVSDVRLSTRLKESASCLVADRDAMTAHYERLMHKLGRADGDSKRVLELNGSHPAVSALRDIFTNDANDLRIESYGRLLYEQAVIAEGSKLKDPAGFARRVNDLLTRALSNG